MPCQQSLQKEEKLAMSRSRGVLMTRGARIALVCGAAVAPCVIQFKMRGMRGLCVPGRVEPQCEHLSRQSQVSNSSSSTERSLFDHSSSEALRYGAHLGQDLASPWRQRGRLERP